MGAAAPSPGSQAPTPGAPAPGAPPATPTLVVPPPAPDPAKAAAPPAPDPAKPAAAPEAYQPFKLPEGFQLADEDAGTITGLAREFKLDQGGAQKIVDAAAQWGQQLVAKADAARTDAATKEADAWHAELQADPALGGAAWPKTQELVARVGSAFDPKGEVFGPNGILGARGLGDQPALARMFVRIGQAIREDAPPPGGTGGGGAQKGVAEVLYPNDRPRS